MKLRMKRMIAAVVILFCIAAFAACSAANKEDPLHLGLNAVITEIDAEQKLIAVKDPSEEGIFGSKSFVRCDEIPVIYCNYETQEVTFLSFGDLQVGDEIILQIYDSELEHLKDQNDAEKVVTAITVQLGTQRIH